MGFLPLQVFLCTDLWKDAGTLHAAYCDRRGVTESFIKNGMAHALHALGVGAQADPACWQYDVVINSVDRRVSFNCTNTCYFISQFLSKVVVVRLPAVLTTKEPKSAWYQ